MSEDSAFASSLLEGSQWSPIAFDTTPYCMSSSSSVYVHVTTIEKHDNIHARRRTYDTNKEKTYYKIHMIFPLFPSVGLAQASPN